MGLRQAGCTSRACRKTWFLQEKSGELHHMPLHRRRSFAFLARSRHLLISLLVLTGAMILPALQSPAAAQDNYEIQVYGSDTVKPGSTMFELHSNYTFQGSRHKIDGVLPTQDALHETLEITHGFSDTFETGFYIFTSARHDYGWSYVGSHIRPRWRAPDKWKLPVGFSVSAEFGFQRRDFSADTWTLELRPIIDKQIGKLYMAVNFAFDKSFAGATSHQGFSLAPAAKVSYDVTKKITLGVEYYGALGQPFGFDPTAQQQHQIFPTVDLNLGPNWEFNFGVGWGLTPGTDGLIVKAIVGRRFNF
jgi:hypothetical protein